MPRANLNTDSTIEGVTLSVNDGCLSPDEAALLRPSKPCEPLDELYARYMTDGYLYLKGLLPRQDVLDARESYFKSLEPTGLLEPGVPTVDGIFNSSASPLDYPGIGAGKLDENGVSSAEFVRSAIKAHTEPWYKGSEEQGTKGFCNHPAIRDFVARMTGWADNTLTVKRTLLRNNTPGNPAIGVHYDQLFMRYGEPTSITAWVPMGDIRLEGGGLIYLEEGWKIGQEMEEQFSRKAKETGMSDKETKNAFNANIMSTGFLSASPKEFARSHGKKWLVTSYEAGDVVLHQAYTVSKNESLLEWTLN